MANAVSELQNEESPALSMVQGDASGRDRIVRNVLTGWASHMVLVIGGFILPRFIDRHIGQTALGVWDFGWSLVSYFSLAQAGIGSSVNRDIAKYRAAHDTVGVNRAASSVMCIQLLASSIVLMLTLVATWAVPWLLSSRLGGYTGEARWVVFLLGTSLAVQMGFDVFNGVVTGCHRWDLHNGINTSSYAGSLIAMIIALSMGGGLRSLSLIYFCTVVATEITRAVAAHKVCPELRLARGSATRSQSRHSLVFGGKTMMHAIARLLLYQTNSIVVVSFLGPAALALYSRPGSLVRHANTFLNKFAFVLTPSASSLYASGKRNELRELLVQTTRFGAYISLPMILTLSILGGPLLTFWMGSAYCQGLVLAILAIGHLAPMVEQPAIMILAGMNAHGRPGLVNLIAAICAVGLVMVTVGPLHWGLEGAALSVAVPLTVANGIYVPVFTCRKLEMPLRVYVVQSLGGPILCALLFAVVLLAGRMLFVGRPALVLAWACTVGTAVMAPLYWRYALPVSVKAKLSALLIRHR